MRANRTGRLATAVCMLLLLPAKMALNKSRQEWLFGDGGVRWPADTVLQALICVRAVLCDRDEALAPLQGSLDVLAGLLQGFLGCGRERHA